MLRRPKPEQLRYSILSRFGWGMYGGMYIYWQAIIFQLYEMGCGAKRLAWALFVLLLSTLVCRQRTELIWSFLFHKFSNFTFQFYSPRPIWTTRVPSKTTLWSLSALRLSTLSNCCFTTTKRVGINIFLVFFFFFSPRLMSICVYIFLLINPHPCSCLDHSDPAGSERGGQEGGQTGGQGVRFPRGKKKENPSFANFFFFFFFLPSIFGISPTFFRLW